MPITEKENILIIEWDEVCYNRKIFWGNNKISLVEWVVEYPEAGARAIYPTLQP